MRKLCFGVQIAAIVAFALASTDEVAGQAKKDVVKNANEFFNFRHSIYEDGKKINPKGKNAAQAYQNLNNKFNAQWSAINNPALQPNTIVYLRFKGVVSASNAAPLASSITFTNVKGNYTDTIFFTQGNGLLIPKVGQPVEIQGVYDPSASGLPGSPPLNILYQGSQMTLYNVAILKK